MTRHSSTVTERDFDKRPYSPDENRVAEFLSERGAGGGDDPIGFILASYAYVVAERNEVRAPAQSTLIPAGKQARFKNGKSWFAVFDWHNDPESFEYRAVYALTSTDGDST